VFCRSLFDLLCFFFDHCVVCPSSICGFGPSLECLQTLLENHGLAFCPFSFSHCVVCPSSFYGFWLSLCYIQIFLIYLLKKIPIRPIGSFFFINVENSNFYIIIQYGCFESFPLRQFFFIFVRQITWFRWTNQHWTSGVNVHNKNSNRFVPF
jgi:hypothetical protein